MLRLDPIDVVVPSSVAAAVQLLAEHGDKAKIIAGGTDVVVNMKHGLHEPQVLVHIGRLRELKGIRDDGDHLHIGAMVTLDELQQSTLVQTHAPGLVRAASLVAGPQLQKMGTIGGNIALDTRCLFYNQTYFWREALGFCLKKDGTVCHVIAGGKKCVAAASNDTATMLLSLGASVDVMGPSGTRTIALDDFYVANGTKNHVLEAHDIITSVRLPKRPLRREGYAKLRHRLAIDYPLLCIAVSLEVEDNKLVAMKMIVSALQARPYRMPTDALLGCVVDEAFMTDLCALAHARCVPVKNIADDPAWRRDMVPVYVRHAMTMALSQGTMHR
jgi:4-hydroxybenzoyl-CoA reductase subunit beta